MPFEIVGPRRSVVIGDADEQIVSTLPQSLGLRTPQCNALWEAFYRNPRLTSRQQVTALRSEIAAIAVAYRELRRDQLIDEKRVTAREPRVAETILTPLLAADPVLVKCAELVAVCDEALAAGVGLTCSSD